MAGASHEALEEARHRDAGFQHLSSEIPGEQQAQVLGLVLVSTCPALNKSSHLSGLHSLELHKQRTEAVYNPDWAGLYPLGFRGGNHAVCI